LPEDGVPKKSVGETEIPATRARASTTLTLGWRTRSSGASTAVVPGASIFTVRAAWPDTTMLRASPSASAVSGAAASAGVPAARAAGAATIASNMAAPATPRSSGARRSAPGRIGKSVI
jgi:hypothetical protein